MIESGISTSGPPSLTCYCGVTWFRYEDGRMLWDLGYRNEPDRRRWVGTCAVIGQLSGESCSGRSYSS